MSFPKYPEYKDSGVDWLGRVPSHWNVVPTRAFVDERNEKNVNGEDQNYLSLMANKGVIPYAEKGDIGNKKPDDLTRCKIVREGDLVLNSMNYGIGSYGISHFNGVCSPVYIILRPRLSRVSSRYVLRIFENKEFQKLAQSFGQGILAHRSAIRWEDLKNIKVPLPPGDEQDLLGRFLDHETARIDALIDEQKRLINLLKEKRQAVISHAVKKGLNPNVRMKDSGVEWLGEVPAHWEVSTLKRCISSVESGTSVNAADIPASKGQFGVLKTSSVFRGYFDWRENKTVIEEDYNRVSCPLKANALIVSRMNTPDLVGSAGLVSEAPGGIFLPDRLWQIVIKESLHPEYIYHFTRTRTYRDQVKVACSGTSSSMQNLGQDDFGNLILVLPPKKEQIQIAQAIRKRVGKIDSLVDEAESGIDLLTERRSTLISAAVTGKIDVRNWRPPTSSCHETVSAESAAPA